MVSDIVVIPEYGNSITFMSEHINMIQVSYVITWTSDTSHQNKKHKYTSKSYIQVINDILSISFKISMNQQCDINHTYMHHNEDNRNTSQNHRIATITYLKKG